MLMRSITAAAFAASLGILTHACGPSSPSQPSEAWNPINDPGRFGVGTRRLADVPAAATLPAARTAWSGDYWPTFKGGIAHRWQVATTGTTYREYLYDILSPSQAAALTSAQIDRLSPAEKFDLYLGRDTFPLASSEKRRVQSSLLDGEVPEWYGLCHGWAAASIIEPEPGASARVRSPRGQDIDFTHSDLEALLAFIYAEVSADGFALIGSRCNAEDVRTDADGRVVADECRDVNPATFHLVVADFIASRQRSFLADISYAREVWNYPVVGYEFQYSNRRALDARDPLRTYRAPGTTELVDVSANITHVDGSTTSRRPNGSRTSTISLFYSLELDAQGRIIGGEWSGEGRPDFLWDVRKAPATDSTGLVEYAKVKALLTASRGGASPDPVDPDPVDPDPVDPTGTLLSFTSWNVTAAAISRTTVVVEGRVDAARVAEVRLVLVRPSGARAVVERSRPGTGGRFRLTDTFAPRFVASVAVEALDAEGRKLAGDERAVPR